MTAGSSSPPRVLCVDDNRDSSDMTALLLRSCGFDAQACYNGHDALKLAQEFSPDVCFIDLNMPGMDGDELAVQLRQQAVGRPLKLVALTAMSSADAVRRTTAAGFHAHLVKPADPAVLIRLAGTGAGA